MQNDGGNDRESVSGAMRGGQAAGTPGAPLPRTDAADTGVGDGGMDASRQRARERADDMPGRIEEHRPHGDPDDGNHGIGGERAGGTGI